MNEVCGECRYKRMQTRQLPNKKGQITASCQVKVEWVCSNSRSDAYGLPTAYDDTCEEWERSEDE